jgi:hypothetical protein
VNVYRIATAAVAGLTLAGLAACSAPAGSHPATGGGGAAGAAPATNVRSPYCEKAPPALVGSALGMNVGKQVTSVDGRVAVCSYMGRSEVMVRFQVSEDASQFRADKKSLKHFHQTVSGVHGLGDQAYFATYGTGQQRSNTLAVRKGAVAVFVTAPKPLSAERYLITRLLARL